MADTGTGVSWHLQYTCPFRTGSAVTEFVPAYNATRELRVIDSAEASGDLFDDLCVHGTTYSRGGKSPARGFRISDAVGPAGGLDAAKRLCGSCSANALSPTPGKMAGCCNWLPFDPDDGDLDASLRAAVASKGLQHQFGEAFLQTSPIGYGLWVSSPLGRGQLELLAAVLPDAGDFPARHGDAAQFRRACVLAVEHNIPLHVRMSPPGHTDFGYHTVFPHCPRCKRGTGERWKSPYSDRPIVCTTCGETYVPAKTASSEQMQYDEDVNALEKLLPANQYQALCDEWARRHSSDEPNWLDQLLTTGELDANAAGRAETKSALSSPFRRLFRWLQR